MPKIIHKDYQLTIATTATMLHQSDSIVRLYPWYMRKGAILNTTIIMTAVLLKSTTVNMFTV